MVQDKGVVGALIAGFEAERLRAQLQARSDGSRRRSALDVTQQ